MLRPVTLPGAPPRLPSTNAPVFGFSLKFRPVSLTTRSRSVIGSKSNPKLVPVIGTAVTPSGPTNVPAVPIGVATPVRQLTLYSRTVPAPLLNPRP
jgi:hypothetical protein